MQPPQQTVLPASATVQQTWALLLDAVVGGAGECVVMFNAAVQGVAGPGFVDLPTLVPFTPQAAAVRSSSIFIHGDACAGTHYKFLVVPQ